MLKLVLLLLMLLGGSKGDDVGGIDTLVSKLQAVLKLTNPVDSKPCELSIFEKGSSRVVVKNKEKFTTIRQAGLKPNDTLSKLYVQDHFIYADKLRLDSKVQYFYNLNLNNNLRYVTCMIIVMSGDISEFDIQIILAQMEIMKLKLVLLQDYNEASLSYYDITKFKAPILRYYTDKTRYNFIKYMCRKEVSEEPLIPIGLLDQFNPFEVCPVSLKARTELPIIKGHISWGQILMLLWFTQYFDLIIKYTPALSYSKDLDSELHSAGAFEADLEFVPFDYQGNHIQYVRKHVVEQKLQYDDFGVDKAKQYAYSYGEGKYTWRPMTLKKGYFELLVGDVTLDTFLPVRGGQSYIIGCTHGYDRQSVHLASRFPRVLPLKDVLNVFPKEIWLAILATIFMLVATMMLAIFLYMVIDSSLVRPDLDVSQIFIRLVAGFTEPDDGSWFKTYSTGRFLMLGWFIFSFFMVVLFCQDLRALLVVPPMEEPIDYIDQVDFSKTLCALDAGDGIMLTRISSELFTTLHPLYKQFNSTKIGKDKHRNNNINSNVDGLNNLTVIHDLVLKDINTTRYALMIMKKRTYRGYVFWLKMRGEIPEIRIPSHRLDTRMNVEQFVMLHSKYHPYSEELNAFILRVEESGVLIAWGDPPYIPISNPYDLRNEVRDDEMKMKLEYILPFLTFLGVGLAVAFLTLLFERLYSYVINFSIIQTKVKSYSAKMWPRKHIGLLVGIGLSLIAIVTCFFAFFDQADDFDVAIAFLRTTGKRGPPYLEIVGMSRDGETKTNGVIPFRGQRPIPSMVAYLHHYNTFIICTAFLVWNPACLYIPDKTKGDKSYLVNHDLEYYKYANDSFHPIACGGFFCEGFYRRGFVLHHGQIMVTSIGSLHRPQNDPVTGKRTHFIQPVKPSKAWTYMDFTDKKMKWGKELPLARYHHCVVKYNESTAFVFGGADVVGENGEGYILRTYRLKFAIVKELRSGFFMRFLDPKNPQNYTITEMPDNGNFPCKENSNRVPTQCGLRINQENGHRELVVPTYEVKEKQPCTAILDMATFTWRKLAHDTRKHINESLESYYISDEDGNHIYQMGGYYAFSATNASLVNSHYLFRHVYRLDGDEGWTKLNLKIGFKVGPGFHLPVPVPVHYFKNNNWPTFSINELADKIWAPVKEGICISDYSGSDLLDKEYDITDYMCESHCEKKPGCKGFIDTVYWLAALEDTTKYKTHRVCQYMKVKTADVTVHKLTREELGLGTPCKDPIYPVQCQDPDYTCVYRFYERIDV